jgi:hypothetical protein
MDEGKRRNRQQEDARLVDAFEQSLLEEALDRISKSGHDFAAVGIDMAADDSNWGLSIITTKGDMRCGTLWLLLPHNYKIKEVSNKRTIKPSGNFLSRLCSGLKKYKFTTAVAVDVPFGWPRKHQSFLETWSAVTFPQNQAMPSQNDFKYRLCDQILMDCFDEEGCSTSVLAVGADKIACAAFTWANLRHAVLRDVGLVDVGYSAQPEHGGITFIETYPSAFVRLNHPDCTEYKTGKADPKENNRTIAKTAKAASRKEARCRLMKRLVTNDRLSHKGTEECANAACSASASDAFDGFLCAIAAWDYLKWKWDKIPGLRMSSPLVLLGRERAEQERERVNKEGWILVRLPASWGQPP